MSKHRLIPFVVAFGLFVSGSALAQDPDRIEGKSLDDPKTEAAAYEIAQRTMSPFCPGRTLADCPSGKATQWRQDIRAMLAQGKSAAEIQKLLGERAGTNLTGAPASAISWALPGGLCIGSVAVLGLVLARFRRKAETPEQTSDEEELDASVSTPRDDPAKEAQEVEERLRKELGAGAL